MGKNSAAALKAPELEAIDETTRDDVDLPAAQPPAKSQALAPAQTQSDQPIEEGLFLVTITHNSRPRRFVWDAKEPLALNHPVTLELVHQNSSIYVQSLDPEKAPVLISANKIQSAIPVYCDGIQIQMRRLERPQAAYLARQTRKGILPSGMKSGWYLSSGCVKAHLGFQRFHQRSEKVKISGESVARITQVSSGVSVEGLIDGVTIAVEQPDQASAEQALVPGMPRVIPDLKGGTAVVRVGKHWWRLGQLSVPVAPEVAKTSILDRDPEAVQFTKIMRWLGAAFSLLVIFNWLNVIPKPQEPVEEQKVTVQLKRVVKPKDNSLEEFLKKQQEKKPPEKKLAEKKPEKKPEKKKPPQVAKQPKPVPKVAKKQPPPPKIAKTVPSKAPPPVVPKKPVPTPAQQQVAADKARLAKSLGFLSLGPKGIAAKNVAVVNERNASTRYQAIAGATQTVAQSGGAYLSKMANLAGGTPYSQINTKGARNISSDAGVTGGRGKALNDVQGRVSLAALYDPNAGEAMGSSLNGGGISLSGEGKISESQLKKVLEKHMQKFQFCYEKALLQNSSLAGNLVVQWTIQSGGKATAIKVVRSQLNNAGLHSCMSQELGRIKFPSPSGGAVIVKFPFAFSSSTL